MKGLIITIVVVAVLGLLVATNPTSEDYSAYLQQDIARDATAGGGVPDGLASLLGGVAGGLLSSTATRNNYLLFSTYSVELGAEDKLTLGILGNFIVLNDGE
jgi:hypothetical protein